MQKQIVRRELNHEALKTLQGIPPLLQRVYAAREVRQVSEVECGFERLHPFNTLLGIEDAVQLLGKALAEQQRILIVGDFDADGATSTALAVRALKTFGAKHVSFLVPNRFYFGYGLTPELVAASESYAPQLIVTVDNGIANHAGVDAARAKGIAVLITDHHLPAATLPNANAIVNPNQPHDPFPSKALAGVGVIFYVMLALRRHLLANGWFASQAIPEPNMSRFLDLVALGTVADLVPLDQNNRIMVHHGLRRIRSGQGIPAIIALLECAQRDFTRAVAADLGFAVAARLNAAGRMDDMSLGINCLLSDDPYHAREIAQQLNQLNDERRHVEQDMQYQAQHILSQLVSDEADLPRGLCLYDESWHQGVIGILASRIKDRHHRPVIIFAPGQENEIKGSARSIPGFHIRDALALLDARHPHLMKKFGGHAMAAGLTIPAAAFAEFTAAFTTIVTEQITDAQLQHAILSDGELTQDEFSLEAASLLRNAGPWGQAFPEPIFDDTFKILEQRIVGDKHLKLRLGKFNKVIDAMAFFVDTQLWPNHRCESVRAAFRLDVNEYKGKTTVQLLIDHLEPQ